MGSSAFQLGNASQDARSSRPRTGSCGAGEGVIDSMIAAIGTVDVGAVQTAQTSHTGHLATGGGITTGALAQPAKRAVTVKAMEMRECAWKKRIMGIRTF